MNNSKQPFQKKSLITNGNSGLAPLRRELPSPSLWDEGYLNDSLPSSSGRAAGVLSK